MSAFRSCGSPFFFVPATIWFVVRLSSMQGVDLTSVQVGSRTARSDLRKGDGIAMMKQEHVAGLDDFAPATRTNARALALAIMRDSRTLLVVLQ
jgi:hypothetical protein